MKGLDFARLTDLFQGSEAELLLALGVSAADLHRYREDPASAPTALMIRLGHALVERGRGMLRVGELVLEEHEVSPPQNGRIV